MRPWFPRAFLLAAFGVAGSCSDEPNGPGTQGPWVQVVAGAEHTRALSRTGIAYCWGANEDGKLGDGSATDGATPTAVNSPSHFQSLVAGDCHTYGLSIAAAAAEPVTPHASAACSDPEVACVATPCALASAAGGP